MQDSRPTNVPAPFDVPLLLTVCTGNVCRSPMAEALLRHHLTLVGLPAVVASLGLVAPVPESAELAVGVSSPSFADPASS